MPTENVILRFGVKDDTAGTLKAIGLQLGQIYAASKLVRAGIKTAKDAFAQLGESEGVLRKIRQALVSTEAASGKTAEELKATAQQLQLMTAFSDEAVMGVQKVLLTFTNIRGDEFDRLTKSLLDMATMMGGDAEDAAKRLGRALQDPAQGAMMLRRSGIVLSEQQKSLIEDFMKAGEVAKAQGVILDELSKKYGGQATVAMQGFGSQVKQVKNLMAEAREEWARTVMFIGKETGVIRVGVGTSREFALALGDISQSMKHLSESIIHGRVIEYLQRLLMILEQLPVVGDNIAQIRELLDFGMDPRFGPGEQLKEFAAAIEKLQKEMPKGDGAAYIDPEEQEKALAEIERIYREHFETEQQALQRWYDEALRMTADNAEARLQVERIYQYELAKLREEGAMRMKPSVDSPLIRKPPIAGEYTGIATPGAVDFSVGNEPRRARYDEEGVFQGVTESYSVQEAAFADLMDYRSQMMDSDLEQLTKWYTKQQDYFAENSGALLALEEIYNAEKHRLAMERMDEELGAIGDLFGAVAAIARQGGAKQFRFYQGMATAEAFISTQRAVAGALAMSPWSPMNFILAATALARGIATVVAIQNQKPPSAHAGISSVPEDATYALKAGERVLTPAQNRDLTSALMQRQAPSVTMYVNIEVKGQIQDADWASIVQNKVVPHFERAVNGGLVRFSRKNLLHE